MKKILIIAPAYYPSSGGVERHIRETTRQLIKLGFQATILVRCSVNLPSHQVVDGVEVWRLPKRDSYPILKLWASRHKNIFRDIAAIHSHDYYPRALKRLLPKVHWVHTFHGYEGYPLNQEAIKSRQALRAEVSWCACVGDFIEKWYGTHCDYVTYGAVDAQKFLPRKDAKIKWDFIFYGRLEPDTGFGQYLRAFAKLVKVHPNVSLFVLGDGSQKSWGEKFVRQNNLRVQFKPAQPDVSDYLHQARVAFVSGYLGILEAALAKKPIVAYWGNPLKKDYLSLHPMAQYMYIAGSIEEIAKQTELASQARAKQLDAFQAWAKQQTWAKIAQTYADQYQP